MSEKQQLDQLIGKLSAIKRVDVPRASSSALNKLTSKIKTRVVRGVSKDTKIQQKLLRQRIYIKRSTVKTQRARVRFYSTDIAAISMVRNAKNGPMKRTIAGKKYNDTFIADGSKGFGRRTGGRNYQKTSLNQKHVLRRKGKDRYPLEVVKIPIAASVEKIQDKVAARIMKSDFSRLYAHEIQYRLNRHAK